MASFSAMAPLVFLFFALLLRPPASLAADSISANQSLSWGQNITSRGGKFVLGFFTPSVNTSSSRYYVGIWYTKISLLTPVWVANREIPLADPAASELKISDDGNLVLLDPSESVVWSSDAAVSSNSSTVAVILESGNLELRDASNSSLVFWQSFDHPTDTWLPESRLGMNRVTNRSQYITSWRSKDDPAPGVFSLRIDPLGTSQFFLFWNSSTEYWATGVWNGQIFSLVPEMGGNNPTYRHLFDHINSSEENYFVYHVPNGNITTRLAVDYASGQIQALTWLENTNSWIPFWARPAGQCSVYALCGPFGLCNELSTPFCNCVRGFGVKSQTDWDSGDKTGGCLRNTPLQCGQNSSSNSGKDGFFKMSNVRLPDSSQALAMVGSSEDCESACLKNCSCSGYSYNSSGCFVWYDDLLNLQDQYNQSDAGDFYLRLAVSDLQSSESKNSVSTPVIVGVVAAAVLACFAIVWTILWRRRSRETIRKSKGVGSSLVSFTYSELQHLTKNFSERIGGGGFGSVFKGWLPDKTPIAVKKLEHEGLRQGEKQFRTEVSTIGTIQHVNLVRLLGFCSERSKRLLVYEFMPNGSLNGHLFRSDSNVLDWKTRYQIAVGTARGLAYLHEKCRDCIIHCDVKPENILLDESFTPKVADFGLAKLMGRDFSRVLTTMRGTRGYLAPEWISGVAITAKADVYSYGMMLFEIISGRRNMKQTSEESTCDFFPVLVTSKLAAGDVQSLADGKCMGDVNREELERACKLACWCIQDDESARPTMGQVVQALEGFLDVSMPPVPRSLITETQNVNYFEPSSTQSSQISSKKTESSQRSSAD